MKAAVAQINAAGGINGHPINITICDDQYNANVAQSCAEKAVAAHDVAVVNGEEDFSASVIPTLQAANTAFIGNLVQTVQDATSPVSFPLTGGAYDNAGAAGEEAVHLGCSQVGVVVGDFGAITNTLYSALKIGIKQAGGTDVADITTAVSQTDYSATVATAVAKGAKCLVPFLSTAATTAILTSSRQQGNLPVTMPGSSLASLSSLGGVANGDYIVCAGRVPTDPSAGVQAASKAIQQYAPGTSLTEDSLQSYAAVLLLKDGLEKVSGSYTPASVLAAMNSLTNAPTDDIFPAYTTSSPAPYSNQPRVFNPTTITYKINGTSTDPAGSFSKFPNTI
jgi:branched-chain amino acid transport system substrate-binding protein